LETVTFIYAQGGDIGMQASQHQDRATSERQLSFDLAPAAKDFAFGGLVRSFRNNKASKSSFVQILQHHGYLLTKGHPPPVGRDAPTRETSLPDGKDMELVITQTSRRFRSLGKTWFFAAPVARGTEKPSTREGKGKHQPGR
jgi:hypothetical protein